MKPTLEIINADCREGLKLLGRRSIQCCVTSPPYWALRDYNHNGQIGLESTPQAYAREMLIVFREVRRVLSVVGTVWLNIGDSYTGTLGWTLNDQDDRVKYNTNERVSMAHTVKPKGFPVPPGLKPKDLAGVPWRVALALQSDGWYLRCDIIWVKPSTMPGSFKDRPTRNHEYIFFFTKSDRYFYNSDAIKVKSVDPGKVIGRAGAERESTGFVNTLKSPYEIGKYRNRRSVWRIAMQPYRDCHFACFPEGLPKLCILAGSRVGDTVLDPFAGSGTTGRVALGLGRNAVLIESNAEYIRYIRRRCETWKMRRIGEMKWETKDDFDVSRDPYAGDERLNITIKEWGKVHKNA